MQQPSTAVSMHFGDDKEGKGLAAPELTRGALLLSRRN